MTGKPISPHPIDVDGKAREILNNFFRQHPEAEAALQDNQNWLLEQIGIGINEVMEITRHQVRHEYDTTDLTIAIQERAEFKTQRDALLLKMHQEASMVPEDVLPDMVKLTQRIALGPLAEIFSDSETNQKVAADILSRAGIERVYNANFLKKKKK